MQERDPVVHDLELSDLPRAVQDRRFLLLLREGYTIATATAVEDGHRSFLRVVMVAPTSSATPPDMKPVLVMLAVIAFDLTAILAFLLSRSLA